MPEYCYFVLACVLILWVFLAYCSPVQISQSHSCFQSQMTELDTGTYNLLGHVIELPGPLSDLQYPVIRNCWCIISVDL